MVEEPYLKEVEQYLQLFRGVFFLKGAIMKIIFLRKKEKKALAQILYELVRKPGCPYELTTILEKVDIAKYEKAFDIMNVDKE